MKSVGAWVGAAVAAMLLGGGCEVGGEPRGGSARGGTGPTPWIASGGACAHQVTLNGNPGAVIASPSITMVFWGPYWRDGGASERGDYDATWADLATNPAFYARLGEYSTAAQTISTGTWAGSTLTDLGLVNGTVVSEDQIRAELSAEIGAGVVPGNTAGRVYVVMLPPGVTSLFDEQNSFSGHHNQFFDGARGPLPIRYVVITYSINPGYTNPLVSHELSESITDPDLLTGWYDPRNGDEISDICRFDYATLDGHAIEKIFSMKTCACVGAVIDTPPPPPPACTAAAWNASAAYPGGSVVSLDGNQYTAAFWSQGAQPSANHGPAGSGQPWQDPVPCGANPPPPPPPPATCSNVAPWSASEPWYAYALGEQHTGSNGHVFSCKNVAYCIYDPLSAVGATYGWTDLGPC